MKQKQLKPTSTDWLNARHGSYMIGSNSYGSYAWSHLIPEINAKAGAFSFKTGDVIELTFNKETYELKFKKSGTNDEYKMSIGPKLFEKSEELCICACLDNTGDEIELTGPIKSNSGRSYDF